MTNPLAYYENPKIMAVKSFVVQAQVLTINNFVVKYSVVCWIRMFLIKQIYYCIILGQVLPGILNHSTHNSLDVCLSVSLTACLYISLALQLYGVL